MGGRPTPAKMTAPRPVIGPLRHFTSGGGAKTMSKQTKQLVPVSKRQITRAGLDGLPNLIVDAGEDAAKRFIEFFTANIRNKNTRFAYARAVACFLDWCAQRKLKLHQIEPIVVAAYIEQLTNERSKSTVKQHLAAIRMLFDWLILGQIVPSNPASAVRGPSLVVKRGRTPVLEADQARQLLDSINTSRIAGLRDHALIGLMCYTFARVGAVVAMRVEDYYLNGRRSWVRLHEKGGKRHEVPCHHNLDEYLHAYITEAGIADATKTPLFRSINRYRQLTDNPITRHDVFYMIKRRAKDAAISTITCCHTFRATGITAYLDNGCTMGNAQAIAGHESPLRATKLRPPRLNPH